MRWPKRQSARLDRPRFRPWAMTGPIIILLIAAPLLGPLRSPGRGDLREDTIFRAVSSLVSPGSTHPQISSVQEAPANRTSLNGTLTSVTSHKEPLRNEVTPTAPAEPPVVVAVFGAVGWLIDRAGVRASSDPVLFEYLLILFAVTLPTATACGFIYRMGRIFELRRAWRFVLALACVLATGWIGRATVLLPEALTTSALVLSTATLLHMSRAKKPARAVAWLLPGGLLAGLATALHTPAAWLLLTAVPVLIGLRLRHRLTAVAILLFGVGAVPPLLLNTGLAARFNTVSNIVGPMSPLADSGNASVKPGDGSRGSAGVQAAEADEPQLQVSKPRNAQPLIGQSQPTRVAEVITAPADPLLNADDEPVSDSVWLAVGRGINRLAVLLLGENGMLRQFPVLLFAVAGLATVLHRNWVGSLKWLAAGLTTVLLLAVVLHMTGRNDMFLNNRPATVTQQNDSPLLSTAIMINLPLLMFFTGGWLRKKHHPVTWTLIGVAGAISVGYSILPMIFR